MVNVWHQNEIVSDIRTIRKSTIAGEIKLDGKEKVR